MLSSEKEFYEKIKIIKGKVKEHNILAKKTISLIASGNVVSPLVHKLMDTDLLYRAAEGKRHDKHFSGLETFYEIEEASEKEIAYLFNADFVDLRPISGTLANIIVMAACSNIGDYILTPSIRSGSHVSQAGKYLVKLRNYRFINIKTLFNSYALDFDECKALIKQFKPALMFLGGSVCIEWQDIKSIVDLAHEYNTIVVYDASHVAGLIATKVFPNPMDYGVDIMTMTTCKTIPGPSHSWIFGKKKYKKIIEKMIFPGFVSGGHLHEYIGAIVSLYEIKKYDSQYGKQIVECSNILADELTKYGFQFLKTQKGCYTETHQIVSYFHNDNTPKEIENKLTKINILVNVNLLPENGSIGKYGIRWGTQEFVRIGGNNKAVQILANIIINYLSDKKPDLNFYRNEIYELKREIQINPFY